MAYCPDCVPTFTACQFCESMFCGDCSSNCMNVCSGCNRANCNYGNNCTFKYGEEQECVKEYDEEGDDDKPKVEEVDEEEAKKEKKTKWYINVTR